LQRKKNGMTIKERILNEASLMFRRQGIRSVTMDDIAQHLGISKRTLYENFSDKNELLRHCILTHAETGKQLNKAIIDGASDVIHGFFLLMNEGIKNMNELNPNFLSDLRKYHHKLWNELFISSHHDHLNEMKLMIIRGIEQGLFREDLNIEIVIRILYIQLKALSDENEFPTNSFPKQEVFLNIIVNFTRGIATPRGIEVIEKLIQSKKTT
jgi:AcrR family transcriptional regulator